MQNISKNQSEVLARSVHVSEKTSASFRILFGSDKQIEGLKGAFGSSCIASNHGCGDPACKN